MYLSVCVPTYTIKTGIKRKSEKLKIRSVQTLMAARTYFFSTFLNKLIFPIIPNKWVILSLFNKHDTLWLHSKYTEEQHSLFVNSNCFTENQWLQVTLLHHCCNCQLLITKQASPLDLHTSDLPNMLPASLNWRNINPGINFTMMSNQSYKPNTAT